METLAAVLIAASSYMTWYLERYEMKMVYPFDAAYATPAETRFRQSDGTSLVVWRAEAAAGKPTLLYFPGNAGALRDRTARFSALIDAGYGLVAVAYRGSSGSEGMPDEAVLTADAHAIAEAEVARPLVLYGESLGTALAVKLAAQGFGDAVVLEAPFTSIVDVVEAQFPLDDLDHLLTQRWVSLGHVPMVRQPLLVIHGTKDKIVPISLGERLFEAAGSPSKRFLRIENKGHSELWTPEMRRELAAFLDGL